MVQDTYNDYNVGFCRDSCDARYYIVLQLARNIGVASVGLGKLFNVSNYRNFISIAKISQSLEHHMNKRCAYCDLDLGRDTPVVTFVQHLAEEHLDHIDQKDIDTYRKIIKKVTG